MPSSFETIARTARSSVSPAERNFEARRSICASSVTSTTSRALSARPGMSIVTFCANSGAVTVKIRRANSVLRMSSSFRMVVYVFARVAQRLAGDAESEQHLLLRPLPFAALLDVARCRAADDQHEQRGRGDSPNVRGGLKP